jgi:hypothetical protein
MARRDGGRGGRVIPGLHDALLARARRDDDHWHIKTDCHVCVRVAALASGEPVVYGGDKLWSAMFDRRYPDRNPEFFHDESLYVVTGDRLTPAGDLSPQPQARR